MMKQFSDVRLSGTEKCYGQVMLSFNNYDGTFSPVEAQQQWYFDFVGNIQFE